MALPSSQTFTLTFGPYLNAAGDVALVGLTGTLRPVDGVTRKPIAVVHVPTGETVVADPVRIVIGEDGTAAVGPLSYTDDPDLSPLGFLYAVDWDAQADSIWGGQPAFQVTPGSRFVAVSTEIGKDVVDYDNLRDSPDVAGVIVPIGVGPRGLSAYDLAVQAGFAGSPAEWLASLVGPPTPTEIIDGLAAQIADVRAVTATDAELASARASVLAVVDQKVDVAVLNQPGGPATLGANGKLPTSVLPVAATTERVPVADAAARLALSATAVQPGDLAIQADGSVWLLVDADPSRESSWVEQLLRGDLVTSVQGRQGDVTLSAADVGADPAGAAQGLADTLTAQVGGQLALAVAHASDAETAASTAAGYASTAANSATAAQGSASSAAASAATTVTAGAVRGDDLWLTKQDGSEVDAGNVRGPKGDQGVQGVQGIQGVQGLPGDLSVAGVGNWNGSVSMAAVTVPNTLTVNLLGNSTVSALPASPGATRSGTVTLNFKQAATGGPFTLAWPSSLEWANDAPAPTMPTAASAELLVHLFWTGVAWRAMVGGVFFP